MNNNDKTDEAYEWLLLSMVGGTDLAADVAERRGQSTFVHSDTLPKDMRGVTRAHLEGAGFVFGEDVDDLFVACTLPAGWKKERTDHSMWSKLVDPSGVERGSIFYKAAFYDRSASLSMFSRYAIDRMYLGADGMQVEGWSDSETQVVFAVDRATGVQTLIPTPAADKEDWAAQDRQDSAARVYMNEHYPDWQNPLAYWDEA